MSATTRKLQLTPKRGRFAVEFLKDHNAAAAARRAGYSENGSDATGSRLLVNVRVQALIAKLAKPHLEQAGVTAQGVIDRAASIAFGDIRTLVDGHGDLLEIGHLTEASQALVAGFETREIIGRDGDIASSQVRKVEVVDRMVALTLLARIFKMSKVEITSEVRTVARTVNVRHEAPHPDADNF